MDRVTREMTFEEEAFFYEKEARAEFAKENGNGDCSTVNGILRRGMRIIRKARQEIASREVVRGRWNKRDWSGISVPGYMACSNCNVMIPTADNNLYCLDRLYYCPNCGAKMDGDGNG